MTEYEVPERVEPRLSLWPVLLSLVVLAALAAGGYGGWKLWQARAQTEDIVAAQDTIFADVVGTFAVAKQGESSALASRMT